MATVVVDGTTITFGSQVAKVHSVDYDDSVTPVEVTDFDSTMEEFLAGMPSRKVTFDVYGKSSIAAGGTPQQLSVAWNDGTTEAAFNAVCVGRKTGGKVKGAIVTSLSFQAGEQ
jgi:hypothetical protein